MPRVNTYYDDEEYAFVKAQKPGYMRSLVRSEMELAETGETMRGQPELQPWKEGQVLYPDNEQKQAGPDRWERRLAKTPEQVKKESA